MLKTFENHFTFKFIENYFIFILFNVRFRVSLLVFSFYTNLNFNCANMYHNTIHVSLLMIPFSN